ncbi:hypothetical protein STCU_08678 [Strigomonas culicis]|uniref:Uncharacterized protein n=1 Tax=Strigomonas culicis TaxID=28005 RepID=S9TX45_9TRYP|nr:hypothetical protein STCU_08678 [Strigomonas culicis]|eukprot:EPY21139.1 hypothetical protein STCU_08678 [Strigomonas culicis]
MRRYQLWPLSSIYSECEMFLSMSKVVRPSVSYFISIWNPKDYPITLTDVKARSKKGNLFDRAALKKQKGSNTARRPSSSLRPAAAGKATLRGRRHERSSVSIAHSGGSSSCSGSKNSDSGSSEPSTTPTITDYTQSDFPVRSSEGIAYLDSSGKYAGGPVRAADDTMDDPTPEANTSLRAANPSGALAAGVPGNAPARGRRVVGGAPHTGVKLATWILRAMQRESDLDDYVAEMHDKAARQSRQSVASFPSSTEATLTETLPPPHIRFAGMEKPPSVDSRSTYTKESIIDEDD